MTELERPPAAAGERYAEIDVTDWPVVGDESRGTKPKRWLRDPETGCRWLMKDTTENVYGGGTRHRKGDDWSERVASDVAVRPGLPGVGEDLSGLEAWDIFVGYLILDAQGELYRFVYLKAAEAFDGFRSTRTGHRVGWVPDCLVETVHELRDLGSAVEIVADHVNPATSPPHMRLLCRLRAPWPDGYEPLSGPEYQPIAA